MNSLELIVELILSIFLEKTTRQNNSNSSSPSSQTVKDNTVLPDFRSKGKGKAVSGEVCNTQMVETTTVSQVDFLRYLQERSKKEFPATECSRFKEDSEF